MKIAAVIAFCALFTSCMKETASKQVTGIYIGYSSYYNPPIVVPDTITVNPGSGSNGIILTEVTNIIELSATTSNDSITIPNQTSAVGQAAIDASFYGTGIVSGDSLKLSITENGNSNFIFVGTKK